MGKKKTGTRVLEIVSMQAASERRKRSLVSRKRRGRQPGQGNLNSVAKGGVTKGGLSGA